MKARTTDKKHLFLLSNGQPVTSLTKFQTPIDEYREAFKDMDLPFIHYYSFENKSIIKESFTRGDFFKMAIAAAQYIRNSGIQKGGRIIHAFSKNSVYDLAFRLGAVFTGTVPVTINWQADENERIIYKIKISDAKLVIHDIKFKERINSIKTRLPALSYLEAEAIKETAISGKMEYEDLNYNDERMIVFTSGTTGNPKGAILPHRSCLANRLTFENYFSLDNSTPLGLLLVNPLHHSNSSAMSDWGIRRPGSEIHIVERYTTNYWKILCEAASLKRGILVAPLVARHFDFLQGLIDEAKLPVKESQIKNALYNTEILIGSAPVGPVTVRRIYEFSGRPPLVRFGSTETCLQVMAVPRSLSAEELMSAFEAGWKHNYKGREIPGYYIGREHPPFTRVKIVKSIDPESSDYLKECETGEPGYVITRGANIMAGYAGDKEATGEVMQDGWYTGLKDIAFNLENKSDGCLDFYWTARESELLIRGGANYACEQVAAELQRFITEHFQLDSGKFRIAVVGLRYESEHEDCCCVTVELKDVTPGIKEELQNCFIDRACVCVSKGAKPDYLRFAEIPQNFKGAILYKKLKKDFLEWLENKKY